MAGFVDSHAHLADPAFHADVTDVIARARVTGARGVVCIGESPDAADRALELVRAHPGFLWHTAGVHPHDAVQFDAARDLPRLREHATRGAVAIGECGLDYFYDHSPRDAQRVAFAAQISLAAELKLPVVVHTRQAEDDTRTFLHDALAAGVIGVLHCYAGSARLAEYALGAGWYVSFSGMVTFKSWKDELLIRDIPTDRLLVESDSPYLAPVPHRGKRNEPAYVRLTAAHVARVRGVDPSELERVTTQNAARLFRLAIDDAST
jgi:TatD DNase family protein